MKGSEFRIRKSRLHNVQQRETGTPMEHERSLKRLSCLQYSMACKVSKPITSEALDY
jgi:hypothetical protein